MPKDEMYFIVTRNKCRGKNKVSMAELKEMLLQKGNGKYKRDRDLQ